MSAWRGTVSHSSHRCPPSAHVKRSPTCKGYNDGDFANKDATFTIPGESVEFPL